MRYGQHIVSVKYTGLLEELDSMIIAKANSYRGVYFCGETKDDPRLPLARTLSFYFPTQQKGEAFRKSAKRLIKRMGYDR